MDGSVARANKRSEQRFGTTGPIAGIAVAVLLAMGQRRASSWHGAIVDRLDDKKEDADVRAAAAQALGAMCDAGSADRLTKTADGTGDPLLVVSNVSAIWYAVPSGEIATQGSLARR